MLPEYTQYIENPRYTQYDGLMTPQMKQIENCISFFCLWVIFVNFQNIMHIQSNTESVLLSINGFVMVCVIG